MASLDPIIAPLLKRDERISEIFYHFEALTTLTTGRTVGRKIGVVQEILLRKYLESDTRLSRRMYLEQFLSGYSGASHKVEFSWYGMETIPADKGEVPGVPGVTITLVDDEMERARVTAGGKHVWLTVGSATPRNGPLRKCLDVANRDLRLAVTDEGVCVDIIDRTQLIASLESKRVGAQRFSANDKLGSGIQTIEKAKQASLVAVDLDMRYNGSVKPLQTPDDPKQLLSLVALGNGVHWTVKDRAILGTYVDFTFLVKDAGIIRYAEYVRELASDDTEFLDFFMAYFKGMTKQEPDDFEVFDDDFLIIAPEAEGRPLLRVLIDHVETVDG